MLHQKKVEKLPPVTPLPPPMPMNVPPCYPNNSPSSKVWYFSKTSLTDKKLSQNIYLCGQMTANVKIVD